ncbi:DUF1275 family protein [Dyella sp. SG609]|uniref:DUF1275 family protein n=1 Tax=Dyella sp. SG609 TaxID=2587018 RepID=UPI00178F1088|nr:DUF1275 family protein [Dyella sp. SG609]NKJ23386.1 uncharacterized membrane protein YoaK (UPF0700 family) [Dyella sp. SG609]
MKLTVPTLLSFAAGYTDTAGFLAMHGLFTAHVTGNFVTIGAALVMGATGIVTKLLALPTFCVAVILARLLRYRLVAAGRPVFRTLLAIQLVLLVLGGGVAAWRSGTGVSSRAMRRRRCSPAWCWWPAWRCRTRCSACTWARRRPPP